MKKYYEKLDDLYEDIKGACIETIYEFKDKHTYNMSTKKALAFYFHEYGGILEDNEVENIVLHIALGIFLVENNYHDKKYVDMVSYAIDEIKTNKYDKYLFDINDRKLIDEDIKTIENSGLLNALTE